MRKSVFNMTTIKHNLLVIVLVVVAIILITSKVLIWGAVFLAAALIIFGIQQLIYLNVKVSKFEDSVSGLEEKNQNLVMMNEKLAEENSFLRERHFQITQIKSILEMNLFEIDTRFKRTVNKLEQVDDRDIKFLGSLSVSLKAKYGIDLKELRFKYLPESEELIVANINPRFLSFGNRKLEWEECRIVQEQPQCALGLWGGEECGLEHQDGQVCIGNAHRSGFLIAALGLRILQGSPGDKGTDDEPCIATDGLPIAILFLQAVDDLHLSHLILQGQQTASLPGHVKPEWIDRRDHPPVNSQGHRWVLSQKRQ